MGESRGVSPEVHDHLHCFEHVELQVVKSAPDSQLLNLQCVSRLVTALNEANTCGVICKLQELDRGVFRCAVVRVLGVERLIFFKVDYYAMNRKNTCKLRKLLLSI